MRSSSIWASQEAIWFQLAGVRDANLQRVDSTRLPELVRDVQSRPVWDGASIAPADADYPRVHFDWHEGHGFVFQRYEDEESWSDFLVTSRQFSTPSIEVELGGQALER